MDIEKNAYVVIINDEDIKKFKDIIDYTYSEDENAVTPPTIRIEDNVQKLHKALAEEISYCFNYKNADEYYSNMGTMILNTKETPTSTYSTLCLALSFIVVPFFILCLYDIIVQWQSYLKSIRKLNKSNEYEKACDEFNQDSKYIYNNCGMILTEHFMFVNKKGIAINYNELLWCYKRTVSYNGAEVNRCFVINTISQGQYRIPFRRKHEYYIDEILNIIYNTSDEVLCGYSKDNRRKYKFKKKELRRINKEKSLMH